MSATSRGRRPRLPLPAGRRGLLLAAAAAALAVTGLGAFLRRPAAIAAAAARRAPLREVVVATGRVLAARAELGVPLAGRVRAVHVERGARVRAGQPLLELEAAALSAARSERRAALRAAEARLAQLETTTASAAGAALAEAEAALRAAEAELRRATELRRAEALPASGLEAAELALERARSRRAAALAARDDAAGADLRLARARVAEAAAAARAAEARLAEAQVVAPADGVVLERRAEPGDLVSGARPLLIVALDGEARVAAELDERHLGRVRPGQPARVSAEAWPDQVLDAVVAEVGPGVDEARGTVELRLRVPSPPPGLAPGMTVSVNVQTGERADALVVPREAVREAPDGSSWCAVARGGRLERVPVRVGLRAAGAVEIRGGIAEGDVVAVDPGAEALLGQRVRPVVEG